MNFRNTLYLKLMILAGAILLSLCFVMLSAQTTVQPRDTILQFYTDLSQFKYSDSLTYVEFPVELFRDQLSFVKDDERLRGEYLITAEILREDSTVERKHWRNVNYCEAGEEISDSQRLYNKNYFLLPEGAYTFRIEVEDPNSGKKGTIKAAFSVMSFAAGRLRISDIQLASTIQKDSSGGSFTKNGYQVIPNPSALYGIGLPVLTGYSEIYNLVPATSDSGRVFHVTYDILDTQGSVVRTQSYDKIKPGVSAVNITQINVVSLVSGEYTLVMTVEDRENEDKTSVYRKFIVYRQADYEEGGALFNTRKETALYFPETEIDEMTEDELKKEFEYARYIATGNDKKTFKKANLEGKKEFLKRFWNAHTMASQTLNEGENYRDDYLARVEMANQMFRGTFKAGWKTDRGRILLVYGKPDDIERMTFGAGTKSHEIWHYHSLQGGVRFIFVDKQELGELELVHSTARGELYDEDWERWLD
ncbi:GWxTD domain-containing protein [bacterium]|nr:GWxTD domain-containing protein [bacterium]